MQVLKIGGNELDDPDFVKGLVGAVRSLAQAPVLVHGGGKEIQQLQQRLGLEPQYIEGLRVTDQESLGLVTMVLTGRVNKRLVAAFLAGGVDAFGMSGIDRASIEAVKLRHPRGDLGQVGRVVAVRSEVFLRLLDDGVMPVVSPLCYGPDGSIFNVNADHVALALARELGAEALAFVSNVPGVLDADGRLLDRLTPADVETLIAGGTISRGMIPKTRAALEAIEGGVAAVRITDLAGLKDGAGTTIEFD
ncbi:MAG: acetylglutamate kinase [Anaerolineae bacterium]